MMHDPVPVCRNKVLMLQIRYSAAGSLVWAQSVSKTFRLPDIAPARAARLGFIAKRYGIVTKLSSAESRESKPSPPIFL
jgi:hypothetical protein